MRLWGQEELQASLFMFQPMRYNPATVGFREVTEFVLSHREQWLNLPNGVSGTRLSFNMPLPSQERVGIGSMLYYERYGAHNNFKASGFAGYSFPTGGFQQSLRLGVQVSGLFLAAVDPAKYFYPDQSEKNIYPANPNDPKGQELTGHRIVPSMGLGAHWEIRDRFYLGASIREVTLDFKPQYHFLGGYLFPFAPILAVKLETVVNYQTGRNWSVDSNLNFFLHRLVWVGLMYRYHSAAGAQFMFFASPRVAIGYAYDASLSSSPASLPLSTHEITISFKLTLPEKGYSTTRYF